VFSSRAGHTSRGARNLRTPKSAGVRVRAQMKSFWKGTRSQRGGRSPKPRRGASFHCRAAGRERSEVPRSSARVRTQGEMKSLASKGDRKPRGPGTQASSMQGSVRSVRETGRRAKMWGLVRGSAGALAITPRIVLSVRTVSAARRKISTDLESSLNVSWYFFRQKLSDCSYWHSCCAEID